MLKGIWTRGVSSGSQTRELANKNENVDSTNNNANKSQRAELTSLQGQEGNSKIGMGTSHLNMSNAGMNMMRFKS